MEIDAENARIREQLRDFENVYYDELISRVTLANAATIKKVEVCSKAVDTEHYTDSSFSEDRKLPDGEKFLVKEIMCRCPQQLPAADVATIFDSASHLVVSEQAGSAIKRNFSLRSLGGGGGVQGTLLQAVAADETIVNHGTPNRGSGLLLPPGDFIEWIGGTKFDCNIVSGAAISPAADRIIEFVFRGWHGKSASVSTKG